MRKTVLISLCLAAAIVLVSCEKMGSENPVAINLDGSTKMMIAMQVNPDLGVVFGEVTISKGDVVHSQYFEFDDGSASVLFSDLQPGIWLIEVALYDEDGYMLYEGSGEAGVVGGQTTTAQIVVEELSGDLEVIIEIPPQGEESLIAYYPFSGSADDHSGNGHDGEVFGATLTTDRFGNLNSAYDFDGIDNYISVSETSPFMLASWTITAWFKADAVDQGDQAIVTKHHNEYGKYNFYTGLGADERSLKGQYETCDSEFDHPIFWAPVIDGEWYFFAYTRDHTTGTVKIYVNDLGAVDSGTYSDEPCADAFPLLIGRLSYGYYFNGAIDDVRIYDRPLSAAEVEELYDESPGGEGLTQLTTDPADDQWPTWSPDGTQIAFESDRSGNLDIWMISTTGGTATQVTTDLNDDRAPSWSLDGEMIAFESNRSGNWDIWMIPADGGMATQITTDPAADRTPNISPDGSMVVFHSNRSGNQDIWIIPAAGGAAVQITTHSALEDGPAWSPDGSQIVFMSRRGGGNANLWLIPAIGGDATQLTSPPTADHWPDWSPHPSLIAYHRASGGNWDICVIPAAGGTPVQLTTDPGDDWSPDWAPDYTRLAFASERSGNRDIWIMDAP